MEPPLYGYEYAAGRKGESPIIRTIMSKKHTLVSKPFPEVETLYDCFQRGLKISADEPCYGYRQKNEKGECGDYFWYTYEEIFEKVKNYGAGIISLNLAPEKFGYKSIGVYCKNCIEWVLTEQACHAFSLTLIPIYDTLGADSVEFILQQTELETIVCTCTEALKIVSCLEKERFLKNLIIIDSLNEKDKQLLEAESLNIYSYNDVETQGKNHPHDIVPPSPDDIHTICYTSGTTGTPKGVCLSHKNSMATLAGCLVSGIRGRKSDVYLSYLPLAHVLERLLQTAILIDGGRIGFFQGSTNKILDDIKVLKPTVFTSVPRLLNKIYDGVRNKVKSKGSLINYFFNKGLLTKEYRLTHNGKYTHGFYDSFIFNPIKKVVGLDHIRLVISGSASLSPEVVTFLRTFIGCPVIEGYGTSETAGATTLQFTWDYSSGNVGGNIGSCEMKLIDADTMGYKVTDRIHNNIPCVARGEICLRGHNISSRFYREELELLDSEGWFHTGDIAVLLTNYSIKIVDRLKNFFKLSQGEYVAAEKLELIYTSSSYISQCYIYGDSTRDSLVGIVVPEEYTIKKWWKELHNNDTQVSSYTYEQICKEQETKDLLLNEMKSLHKQNALRGFERVINIYVDSNPWTDQNNMLTPTFKLKRNIAKQKYQDIINSLYSH
ncbi:hypothetical protein WA158_006280 [Blastocystis sp. Blastoise]